MGRETGNEREGIRERQNKKNKKEKWRDKDWKREMESQGDKERVLE